MTGRAGVRSMTGTVTVVQEGRFQVRAVDGRAMLFLLASNASLEPQDLPALAERAARVTLRYSTPDGLIAAGLAHDVTLPRAEPRRRFRPARRRVWEGCVRTGSFRWER